MRFQHTPIDLTRLRTKKVSDNKSFLSILGSSSDEDCRPLHGNQTPKGSGQSGKSPGAPVPVYGMSFVRKVQEGYLGVAQAVSYHHQVKIEKLI